LDEIVNRKVLDLLAATKTSGDLRKAAKDFKLDVKTSPAFDRNGAVEGLGQAVSFVDAFTKPDGSVFGPVLVPPVK
jgi:hypothetical protein